VSGDAVGHEPQEVARTLLSDMAWCKRHGEDHVQPRSIRKRIVGRAPDAATPIAKKAKAESVAIPRDSPVPLN